jgi:hypothetical protein
MGVASNVPLQGGAQAGLSTNLPLQVQPFQGVDPMTEKSKMYSMADKIEDFKANQAQRLEEQQQREDRMRDKSILDNYLRGGGDLFSPEGIDNARKVLGDKLSSATLMNLDNLKEKKQQIVQDFRTKTAKMEASELETYQAKYEESLKTMTGPLSVYEKTKEEKGEAEAQKAFAAAKQATVQMMSQEKDANGAPKFAPQALQKFSSMTPEILANQINTTKWHRDLLADELQTKLRTAQVENYESLAKQREAKQSLDEEKVKLLKEKVQKSGASSLSSADRETMAEFVRTQGPSVLSRFGLSPNERKEIISTVTGLNAAEGKTAREGAADIADVKAYEGSLKKMQGQYDAITAFEKTMESIGGQLKKISKKVDATGVPVVERWLRGGKRAVEGDPDVTEFNARMQTFRTEAARTINNPNLTGVLSDNARHEIEEVLPNASSAEQIERGVDTLISEGKLRRDNITDQISEVRGKIRKVPKAETSASPEMKVSAGTQAGRDDERARIIKGEYADAKEKLAKLPTNATADDRHRAEQDVEGLKKELKNLGVKTDDEYAPPKPAAKKPTVSNW